jgi:hypothetical protein
LIAASRECAARSTFFIIGWFGPTWSKSFACCTNAWNRGGTCALAPTTATEPWAADQACNPVILTDSAGRDPDALAALQAYMKMPISYCWSPVARWYLPSHKPTMRAVNDGKTAILNVVLGR